MAKRHEVELSDDQWELIKPHLPKRERSRLGGRPPVDDRACWEGILWVLRSGARWRDLPERFPSPKRGLIDWDEVFVDGTFSPAKKGGTKSEKPNAERVRSWWWWRMVREFRSQALPRLLVLQRSRLRKRPLKKSRPAKRPPR